ncbi:hypothetical protein GE09DRAFT_1020306 [Coniochaeta sp. 2T2.1]|nr:hypothetical protein GE09DRAFT_1020306 [Coniochaeta sp. 2T2.1]
MADLILLPATTYRPPSPQDRRRAKTLNPIIEDDGEDIMITMSVPSQAPLSGRTRRNRTKSIEKIEQWLSPMSDHFPTPRGMHFMAAPIMPSTPAAMPEYDADDTNSETSSSVPSVPSTQMWNSRESVMTAATEFNDLYDISDDEKSRKAALRANGISRKMGSKSSRNSRRISHLSVDSRKSLTPLVIPQQRESSSDALSATLKKQLSPVPPTPPTHVSLEAAQLSFMHRQHALEVPTISAEPSLDGSLNSEELAAMSAPPTPLIGATDDDGDDTWSGVQLQPGALATLQALSGGDEEFEEHQEQVIEVLPEMSEMPHQPPRLVTNLSPPASTTMSPIAQRQLAGLTKLDIPSPGGFFSDLSSASRDTWQMPGSTPSSDMAPATSATAEQFYKTASWSRTDGSIPPPPPRPFRIDNTNTPVVERVVELPWGRRMDDLPTAVRVQATPITALRIPPTPKAVPDQTPACVEVTEILPEYDPDYVHKQEENAVSHRNRTETWLMAQRAYLKGIINVNEDDEAQSDDEGFTVNPEHKKSEAPVKEEVNDPEDTATATATKKKTVRFSEAVETAKIPKALPSKLNRQESAYWRAFADMTVRSQASDAFVHRLPRFEALQAQRMSLREAHRNQLFGKYQLSVVPQSAKKRMSANVVRGDDQLVDDNPDKIRADKEREALSQMAMSTWHVAATKLLNGGRLIAAPIAKRLARQSRMLLPSSSGASSRNDRARILDLGGMGTGDWAWHAALQYPNAKIYTVTTKAIRQLSNCNIRGPPNHRQVAVDRLTRLPFGDDQFDLVSARELHSILKMFGENGEDEWEACLTECLRVLKPGGYIDFSVLDSDVMNAGPLGLAKSVEFGFALKTLGYDPTPSKMFVNRLYRAGFEDVRRAWACLPLGPKPRNNGSQPQPTLPTDPETGLPPANTVRLEAMVVGEADHVAAVTGFVAGWSWERWILRTEMEKNAGELRLADTVTSGDKIREAGAAIEGVHAIVEEGRARGAAFRMLRGYAKKPRPMVGRR